MTDQERNSGDIPCTRCGQEASWRFLDDSKSLVEVTCPDCGRWEVPRAEFDQAEFEIVEGEERRE